MSNIRKSMLEAFGLEETILDKNAMKALITIGGSGSGKSYIVKKILANVYPPPKVVDSDKIFQAKLKSANLSMKLGEPGSSEREAQTAEREKAKAVNLKVLRSLLNGMLPILLDTTGKSYDGTIQQKQALEALGYDVMAVIVDTSLDISQQRNAKRERSLRPQEVETIWNAVQSNIPRYKEAFKWIIHLNNNSHETLDEAGLIKSVNKFFSAPVSNPIGQELLAKKDEPGTPIVRKVSDTDVQAFA